jgi:hypothetical protein
MVIKDQNNHINIETHESVINRKTMILDIHFIKDAKYQVLLTSSNDGYVRGWKLTNDAYKLAQHPDNEDEFIEH